MVRRIQLIALLALLGIGLAYSTHGQAATSTAVQPAAPNPVVTFDLTVSLEWQPGDEDSLPTDLLTSGCENTTADELFLQDLQLGLRGMAAYLYAFTEGQFALRDVKIYSGGEQWENADIRILANSTYRPTAFVGGIVKTPTPYTSPATFRSLTFYPGEIFLSRLWNGNEARCGAWSEPEGWRTLGHEWGHYALYLWDEYFNQFSHLQQYCTTTGFSVLSPGDAAPVLMDSKRDSLMAYHYTTDELWKDGTPAANCNNTPQMLVHGLSDWRTLEQFYPVAMPAILTGGPDYVGSPAEALFNVTVVPPALARPRTSNKVTLSPLPKRALEAQTYLIRPRADGFVDRILGQGGMVGRTTLPFWGVQTDTRDRAAVVYTDTVSGTRRYFPQDYRTVAPLSGSSDIITPVPSAWQPSLRILPVVLQDGQSRLSETTGLRVTLEDCTEQTKRVQMQYCPAGGQCGMPVDVPLGGDGRFTNVFAFPVDDKNDPPAAHGYIYVRNPESGEETLSWYQVDGGVGPVHIGGHPPLAEGLADVDLFQGTDWDNTNDTRVLYSPAQQCTVDPIFLPQDVVSLLGTPLEVQPVVARREIVAPWNAQLNDPPLVVRLNYDQGLLDRLNIGEDQLVVLRLIPGQREWIEAKADGRSDALNWIAASPQNLSGQGIIYSLGYRAPVGSPTPTRIATATRTVTPTRTATATATATATTTATTTAGTATPTTTAGTATPTTGTPSPTVGPQSEQVYLPFVVR